MTGLKRIACIIFALLIAAVALTACGGDKADEKGNENNNDKGNTHTHETEKSWTVDTVKHWRVCDADGEKFDEADHDLQGGRCTVCMAEVVKQGEYTNVYFFDAHDNWVRCIHYDKDGNTTEDTVEYTYFEDGNIDYMKLYKDGKLFYEGDYEITSENYNYEKISTEYSEDGSKIVVEVDEKGDVQREAKYKADGTVEYEYKTIHTYNEKGKKDTEKTYDGEKLIREVKWVALFEDSWGGGSYKKEVTIYNADGTTTVKVYNENDELIEG